MAVLKTLEAQAGNGNGCGKDHANQTESIFCDLSNGLDRITVEVGAGALTGVDTTVKNQIPPERALAFAARLVAKDILDAFSAGARGRQGPLTDALLAVVGTAKQQILDELYGYYGETNEQTMVLLAQAIRKQF